MSRTARARTQSSSSVSSEYSVDWQVGGQDLVGDVSMDYDPECQRGSKELVAEYAKFSNTFGYGKIEEEISNKNVKLRAETMHGFGGNNDVHNKSIYVLLYVTSLCLGVGWLLWRVLPSPEVVDFY